MLILTRQDKTRHIVENLFSALKQFRRLATRYDKHVQNYLGFVHIAAILHHLKWLILYYNLERIEADIALIDENIMMRIKANESLRTRFEIIL